MAPLKGELGAKRSEGLSPKGLTSCVKGIRISHLDKSLVSAIMKTKGDTISYCVELCQRLASHPAAFLTRWLGGLFLLQ